MVLGDRVAVGQHWRADGFSYGIAGGGRRFRHRPHAPQVYQCFNAWRCCHVLDGDRAGRHWGHYGRLAHGAEMPIQATVLFAIATAMGMATGRQLVSRLSECYVQRGFAVVLIMVAIGLVTRAILASVFGSLSL